jgi:hypothetical protein
VLVRTEAFRQLLEKTLGLARCDVMLIAIRPSHLPVQDIFRSEHSCLRLSVPVVFVCKGVWRLGMVGVCA